MELAKYVHLTLTQILQNLVVTLMNAILRHNS